MAAQKHRMFHLISPDINYDFLGKSKPFIWASTILAIVSAILLFTPGLNYGIDFTGGAEVQLKVPADWDISKLRNTLDEGGVKDPKIVQIGNPQDHEFLVKVQAEPQQLNQVSANVSSVMTKALPSGGFQVQRTDVVGPQAGATLRKSAILSIFYAMMCIAIYIAFRFDFRYAPGVLRALGIDVIITAGIWVLMQREFNLTVLAAFLTIAGYSCNDTIVIYDRIRDYSKSHPTWSLEQAINRSTNLNLGRTLLTTMCTMFVIVSLYFFGGPVLEDFALPLIIGFTVSVPSTIFVATPMIVFMEKRRLAREAALAEAKRAGASGAKPARA